MALVTRSGSREHAPGGVRGFDTTRRALLEAAGRLVAEEGIGALTMSAVANRAGVSRATVHRYFSTKLALARAMEDRGHHAAAQAIIPTDIGRNAQRPGNARQRLLDAGRALFSQHGYAGTSLRAIAEAADLSQPMVYRYFASKEALFHQSAIAPLNAFIDEYLTRTSHDEQAELSPIEYARQFCGSLYDILSQENEMLRAVVSLRRLDGNAVAGHPLSPVFAHFLVLMNEGFTRQTQGVSDVDGPLMCRLAFGMVFAAAVHGDWLLPSDQSRADLIEEMAQTLVFGIYRSASLSREPPNQRGSRAALR